LTANYPGRIVHLVKGWALRRLRGTETQAEFAMRLAVHANTLARYERDELPIPETVARLAKLLTRERPKKRRT
jgi:transcriptional regulator with XRE-family HTH domain